MHQIVGKITTARQGSTKGPKMGNDLRELLLELGIGQGDMFDGLNRRVVVFIVIITRSRLGHANPFEAGDIVAASDDKVMILFGKFQ
ncbi:hypothetical protein [Sphingomonas sp. Leaf37]|uniref:hypothetical protein n=1 Tax=Sphingomonas sp. Leaf37 TaxID=2876552 RepID=UPI001E62C552|nr:hypothetical protein [Sphingomonas sp. Leaf37]